MNNMKTTFGETLRELRKRQMMTQLDLEKKTGIKRSYIAQIETNQITTVSIPTVRRLADGLSVAVSDLVNAVGRDSNQPPAIIFTQARDAKDTTFYIKLFVFGAITLFAITGGCIIYWTVTNAFNSKRITDSQVAVYKAQEQNIGKPQIIEQRYYAPTK